MKNVLSYISIISLGFSILISGFDLDFFSSRGLMKLHGGALSRRVTVHYHKKKKIIVIIKKNKGCENFTPRKAQVFTKVSTGS